MPVDREERRRLAACRRLDPDPGCDRKAQDGCPIHDPYVLRKRALDEELTPWQIGRVFFHLNQRRGFRSNRKTDGRNDDASRMKEAVKKLEAKLEEDGARTVGEWLAARHARREPVRFRPQTGGGTKLDWDAYPARTMLEAEFDAICDSQRRFHPTLLTADVQQTFKQIIFHQRPLKSVNPGQCTLDPDDSRAPRALPSAQRFRVLQDLNHIRLREPPLHERRSLTLGERDVLLRILERGTDISIGDLPRKLRLPDATFFETGGRVKRLKGDETAKRLRRKEAVGPAWHALSLDQKDRVVERLIGDGEDAEVLHLITRIGLSLEQAERALCSSLPPGYGRLGRTALRALVCEMAKSVITYAEAAQRAGYDAAGISETLRHDWLPRYQEVLTDWIQPPSDARPSDPYDKRMGRFSNPTVHVGLNQLRRVANALIREYGCPDEVVLELGRELKQSRDERARFEKRQAANQKRNEEADSKLPNGITPTGETRMRYRLWKELGTDPLDRRCPYSGEQIGICRLFSADSDVEIDHILPFSRTLDNSVSNRTLCTRKANRWKGNRSPAEAVAEGLLQQCHIDAAIANSPANRRWRFMIDAMERFESDEGRFLDRHLHETRWLGRLAKRYLAGLVGQDHVWVIPGRLTGLLRGKWGLNGLLGADGRKNRNDHRHHAIDAAVVGITDRGLLQKVSSENRIAGERGISRLRIPDPFESFRQQVQRAFAEVIVSHRIDHGKGGLLHEETAYGIVEGPEAAEGYTLVRRKPVTSLTVREIDRIRDLDFRKELQALTAEVRPAKERSKMLGKWSRRNGVRNLRILEKRKPFILVEQADGARKALIPGKNHHVKVFQMPDGTWCFHGASMFDVNSASNPAPPPGGREIMCLHKWDMIEVDRANGAREIMQIRTLDVSNKRVRLAPHNEGGALQKRHDDEEDHFRWYFLRFSKFQDVHLRPVVVTETGRVIYQRLS